jgi:hypothetical protein
MSEKYCCTYYKASEYSCLEDAKKNGDYREWETTYGYSTTMDAFVNFGRGLKFFKEEARDDLRFVWIIDDVKYPECNYYDAYELLDRSYEYFSKYITKKP